MHSRWWARAFGVLVLGLVVVAGWFALQADPIFSSEGKVVVIVVAPHESVASIANDLHAKGVIASPLAFRLESALVGPHHVIAGKYQVVQRSSFWALRSILSASPNIISVDVTPGQTLHEVAIDVALAMGNTYGDEFLAAATNAVTPSPYAKGSSLEGLIGAGNYVITPGESPSNLVQRMVASFDTFAASHGLSPTTTLNGLDAYQLITAASIVEKEGYYPVNMPKVARVIYNRLARGGPLQMDATVLYYLGQDGGTVTPSMLEIDSPYNTYKYSGLTPTPICTISSYSLNAVLHAPAGTWLYFTLVNQNGTMAFSTTFAQQLANEKLAASRGIK